MEMKNTALVIETNNLHGGAGTVVQSLSRLLAHLRESQPLQSLGELVVTHEGTVSDAHVRTLEEAAGRDIAFVEIPDGAGYYEAKERGFDATHAEIVLFADGDCWPDDGWLAKMIAPFSSSDARVVAGRTVYRDDLLGIAATTIDFMYFSSPFGAHATRNFYANNVAFRREVFAELRYSDGSADGFYRGNCQVAGMKLVEKGVPVTFVPAARTVHRFPDSAGELVKLRMLRGEDTVVLAKHLRDHALPRGARWLMNLGPASPALVLGARFACSVNALNQQDMPTVRGAKKAAAVGLIAGLSLIDAAGAVKGLLPLPARKRRRAKHKTTTLSYHGDGDKLAA